MIDFEHRKVAISLRRDEPIARPVEWQVDSSHNMTSGEEGSTRRSEMATDCISN